MTHSTPPMNGPSKVGPGRPLKPQQTIRRRGRLTPLNLLSQFINGGTTVVGSQDSTREE